jgi:hypothetical protein
MGTKEDLERDLKIAMKQNDTEKKNVIRMVMTNAKLAEVEKGQPLDESGWIAVLHKEIKSRRESLADAERAGRNDLMQAAEAEIKLLEVYLPKGFAPEELETMARQAIQEANASSIKEMGQVMKLLMPRLQGRASGDQASQVVRRLLS